ncbi:MAG: hypothetical protein HZC36_15190 [Armatimonadetes bacterium]|nr:hypothetical protein [Armatimonadota bacterium]
MIIKRDGANPYDDLDDGAYYDRAVGVTIAILTFASLFVNLLPVVLFALLAHQPFVTDLVKPEEIEKVRQMLLIYAAAACGTSALNIAAGIGIAYGKVWAHWLGIIASLALAANEFTHIAFVSELRVTIALGALVYLLLRQSGKIGRKPGSPPLRRPQPTGPPPDPRTHF